MLVVRGLLRHLKYFNGMKWWKVEANQIGFVLLNGEKCLFANLRLTSASLTFGDESTDQDTCWPLLTAVGWRCLTAIWPRTRTLFLVHNIGAWSESSLICLKNFFKNSAGGSKVPWIAYWRNKSKKSGWCMGTKQPIESFWVIDLKTLFINAFVVGLTRMPITPWHGAPAQGARRATELFLYSHPNEH